jgi:hypothetical protein
MKKVVIFFIVMFILSVIACSGASTPAEHAPEPTINKEAKTTPNTNNYEFGPGNYKVEKNGDIFPGTYHIKCISGTGNVIANDNGWDDMINLIMAPKTDEFYIHEYKNATLHEGATLQIENVKIKLIGAK